MVGKRRDKGAWVAIAKGRSNPSRQRDLVKGSGLSNVPRIGDVGSAAYRRLIERGQRRG